MTTGTVLLYAASLLSNSLATTTEKCSLILDEMNCVNATVDDLPREANSAKDLRLLDSRIPILKKGDIDTFTELTDFVCLDCQIHTIHPDAFDGLAKLIRIELYGNNLTLLDLNLISNTGTKDLIISWNPTLIIPQDKPFLISRTLTYLDLTGNDISKLSPLTFIKLPNLKTLSLAGNHIQYIPTDTLTNLKNLKFLDISRNKLRNIALSAIPTNITKLRLAWNPWFCDCSLLTVIQWVRSRDVDDDVRCFQPRRVKWKEFTNPNCTLEMVDAIRQRKINSSVIQS